MTSLGKVCFWRCGFIWSFILLLLLSSACIAVAPSQSGTEVIQELVQLITRWSGERPSLEIFEEASSKIDFHCMAESALLPDQWKQLSKQERAQYISSFQNMVQSRYYKRWRKLFAHSRLVFADEAKTGADSMVKMYLTKPGQSDDTVIWHLRRQQDKVPRIISLAVNGHDLLTVMGQRLQKQFETGGTRGLLDWLKRKSSAGSLSGTDGDKDS